MFPDSEPDYDGATTGEDIVDGSGKMQVLDRMLAKLKQRGHRVVLFSQVCGVGRHRRISVAFFRILVPCLTRHCAEALCKHLTRPPVLCSLPLQFNIMLDIIEDYLIFRGYKYRRLDGSTNRIQRMIDIEVRGGGLPLLP